MHHARQKWLLNLLFVARCYAIVVFNVLFWVRRARFPLVGRYPRLVMLFNAAHYPLMIMVYLVGILGVDSVPCAVIYWICGPGAIVVLNICVLRAWLLLFQFELTKDMLAASASGR